MVRCMTLSLLLLTSMSLFAQTGQLPLQPGVNPVQAEPRPGAMPGGGVIADFDTLMFLIQQVIEPDTWLAAGGTSTIMPYPAGVYINAKGQLKHRRELEQVNVSLVNKAGSPKHPWRQASKLRTVSLKSLDAAIKRARDLGVMPHQEVMKLAGLARIEYVRVVPEDEDILLAGPSGIAQPGIELHDLVTLVALANQQGSPMGCSIDPSNEGLLAAQAFLQTKGAQDQLARRPKEFVKQLESSMGAHNVSVFGLPANCSTAVALIDADELMKRVGFGQVVTAPRIKSYFDFLDQQTKVPDQSLIRWWFSYADEAIRADPTESMFQFPENCVAVLSEQQWVTRQGRQPTGDRDPAADKFASEFSKNLPELRKVNPACSRLCGVFETSLALQIALETTGQRDLQTWFPNLFGMGQTQLSHITVEPKQVDGLAAWHRLRTGTTLAVVSGGVNISPARLALRDQWASSKHLVTSVVPEKASIPSFAHSAWWWD